MIDPAHPIASWFLWIAGATFAIAFALPLLIMPLKWATRLGWKLPEDTRLTRYFGRCLGGVAVAICAMCFRMAPTPTPFLFELIALIGVLMTIVHIWGALEKSQPILETLEIGLYATLAALALWIRLGFG